jgi:thioredoxin reductase
VKTREWSSVPLGKTVAVIGAGNTAIDAVTQAKRLGAEHVLLVYRKTAAEMPAYNYEYELAKHDGIEFVWQAAPVGILSDEGDGSRPFAARETDGSIELFDIPCAIWSSKAVGQTKRKAFFEKVLGVDDGRTRSRYR